MFVGAATPEVFGDYLAGPGHVLPTCGSARFASSLGVEDFLRRSHTVRFTQLAAGRRAAAAAILAERRGAARPRRRGAPEAAGMSVLTAANVTDLVRPELRALKAYHLDLEPCRHKLDQNEVPRDLPRRIKERVAREWVETDWARYPDFHADALRQHLGRLHGWPWEGVLAGNGSNELLGVALTAFVAPGTEVLGAEPGFGLYPSFVLKAGGVARFLPPRPDLRLPIDELQARGRARPAPAGPALHPEQPDRRRGGAGAGGGPAWTAWRRRCCWTTPTASSAGTTTGRCCGPTPTWCCSGPSRKPGRSPGCASAICSAAPELVTELIKVKLPYNLGHATVLAGRAALAARAEAERRVRWIVGRRPQWAAMLAEAGFEVFPSEANFLLIRCGEAKAVARGWSGGGSAFAMSAATPASPAACGFRWETARRRDTRRALEQIALSREAGEGRGVGSAMRTAQIERKTPRDQHPPQPVARRRWAAPHPGAGRSLRPHAGRSPPTAAWASTSKPRGTPTSISTTRSRTSASPSARP